VEERLFAGLAAQAGLVLRMAGLRSELRDRHVELVVRADELKASRERLIRTQDDERRRLERDIHDGAQQHLVALIVNVRLAQTIAVRSPERAARVLSEQADAARVAIETLSSLSRGIYPTLLSDEGLAPALLAAVATSPVPVTIDAVGVGRLPASVEAALYFCCVEAVQNAAKHSGARSVSVRLDEDQDRWRLTVEDNGTGFNQALAGDRGAGLVNMSDRLDAIGGTVTVGSLSGRGTTITAVVPRSVRRGS
jgi:signal transduction histidine kinase